MGNYDEDNRPILNSPQPSAPTTSYQELVTNPPTYEQSKKSYFLLKINSIVFFQGQIGYAPQYPNRTGVYTQPIQPNYQTIPIIQTQVILVGGCPACR